MHKINVVETIFLECLTDYHPIALRSKGHNIPRKKKLQKFRMFQILAVVSLEQHEGTKTLLIDQSINYTSQDLLESSSQIFLQATYF